MNRNALSLFTALVLFVPPARAQYDPQTTPLEDKDRSLPERTPPKMDGTWSKLTGKVSLVDLNNDRIEIQESSTGRYRNVIVTSKIDILDQNGNKVLIAEVKKGQIVTFRKNAD